MTYTGAWNADRADLRGLETFAAWKPSQLGNQGGGARERGARLGAGHEGRGRGQRAQSKQQRKGGWQNTSFPPTISPKVVFFFFSKD